MAFVRVLLFFQYKHLHSGETFDLALVQQYDPSSNSNVDQFSYDRRFNLPKIVRKKKYSLIPVQAIVLPVRLMPDFELLSSLNKKEYFVRYNIESSALVDDVYDECVPPSKGEKSKCKRK